MKLASDQRGAIIVMGLFMAIFLAGCLFHVMGIGEAILHRERMQDAADVAAYNGAVMHAHGMNLLVMINMVMAALLAVLVTLKLVETICIALMLAIGLAAFFAPPLLTAIEEIELVRERVAGAHESARKVIYPTLEGLHATSQAVRVVVPWAAQVRVLEQSRTHYAPPASFAISFPTRATLPVADDAFDTLCSHAGDYTGDLVAKPFGIVPDGGVLRDAFDGIVEDLLDAGAGWFCGNGATPKAKVKQRIGYPQGAERRACFEMKPGTAGYDAARHERACQDAQAAEAAMRFDVDTGDCVEQCEDGGPYDQRDERAREQCDPRKHPGRRDYVWQQQLVTYRLQNVGGVIQRTPEGERLRAAVSGKRPPCGRRNAISESWESRQRDDDGALLPVCSDGDPFPKFVAPGDEPLVRRREITRILGCEQVEKKEVGVDGEDRPSTADNDKRVPQKLVTDAYLGGDAFQLRSLAVGKPPRAAPEKALSVSVWGKAPARSRALALARKSGRVAVAQAEYFFESERGHEIRADEQRGRYMWELGWSARLRRVRPPGGDASPGEDASGAPGETGTTAARACQIAGLDERRCRGLSPELMDLVIH